MPNARKFPKKIWILQLNTSKNGSFLESFFWWHFFFYFFLLCSIFFNSLYKIHLQSKSSFKLILESLFSFAKKNRPIHAIEVRNSCYKKAFLLSFIYSSNFHYIYIIGRQNTNKGVILIFTPPKLIGEQYFFFVSKSFSTLKKSLSFCACGTFSLPWWKGSQGQAIFQRYWAFLSLTSSLSLNESRDVSSMISPMPRNIVRPQSCRCNSSGFFLSTQGEPRLQPDFHSSQGEKKNPYASRISSSNLKWKIGRVFTHSTKVRIQRYTEFDE